MNEKIREQILIHAGNGTLLHAIFHEYGKTWREDNDPTVVTLATLHNEGKIDLLSIVTPDAIAELKGHVFWNGQHVYRALISRLEAPASDLLKVVQLLIEAAGNDMAAGMPVEEFAKWCACDPRRPFEILDLVDQRVPDAARFLTIAIKQGVEVDKPHFLDRAYAFLKSGGEVEKQATINALGQVPLAKAKEWDRFLTAFEEQLPAEDAIRASMITAIGRRFKDAPKKHQDRLLAIGKAAVDPLGDIALDTAARTLAFDTDHLPDAFVDALLEALRYVKGAHDGTVEMLDMALRQLVKGGRAERARVFLEQLLRREDDQIELETFDSLCYAIHETGGQMLEDWTVAWLLDGDYDLCGPLSDGLFGAGNDDFIFAIDFTRFGLGKADYAYLARKAIGTFFLKPSVMTSILVSLLRSAPADAADEIADLVVDPILLNYAGVRETYLQAIADDDDDPAQAAVRRALAGQDTYFAGLDSIGQVPELHPSEKERQLEWERHSDSMAAAWRAARKKSIFASIATESLVLYGTGSISWISDERSPPRRLETSMGSISHSMEMPRIDTVDPLGLQLMLIQFRGEGRPE